LGLILEQIVNGQVFENETDGATERVSGLLWGESLEATAAHPIVHSEVMIDGFETVVGFLGNDMGILTFGVTFPTDDAFVSETRTNIVESGTTRDNGLRGSLMLGEDEGNSAIVGVEDLGEIAVGKQSPLAMRLFTKTDAALEETFRSWHAVDATLNVLRGADIEENRNELGVDHSLTMAWRVLDADGHPEELAMHDVVERSNVLSEDFEEHVGAELPDTRPTDAGELLGNAVSQGVFQGFSEEWGVFLVEEVGLATHGRFSVCGAFVFF
jgi:hypothetical protein